MSDDLISRQAVVELIERMKLYHQDADDIAEMIANMPPVQPSVSKTEIVGDVISRQAALRIFEEHCYPVRYDHNSIDKGMTLPGIVEVLNMTPPAQRWIPCTPETMPSAQTERPKGEWIYGEHNIAMCDGYWCNQCGFFVPWDYKHKFIDFIKDYHWCPSCGADMRGEQDERSD